jgi:hypothetical protein
LARNNIKIAENVESEEVFAFINLVKLSKFWIKNNTSDRHYISQLRRRNHSGNVTKTDSMHFTELRNWNLIKTFEAILRTTTVRRYSFELSRVAWMSYPILKSRNNFVLKKLISRLISFPSVIFEFLIIFHCWAQSLFSFRTDHIIS